MKRIKLLQHLQQHGCVLKREGVIRVFRGQRKAAQQRRTPKYPCYQCDPRLRISVAAVPRWMIRGALTDASNLRINLRLGRRLRSG
jgi:hypothetical protein